ncbi:hypothetical protein HHK36_030816 [Tetracentron sinense]|uniref:BHLH domain-containing protein n=1 Tax=Tetracentron sinense TaxID=13715 RepID=A0A834YDG7_TETSI|nr:hypothetical protein HHK36_030816 [Tetracentron sinense]
MEYTSARWLSELDMEDPIFNHQCELDSLDDFTTQQIAATLGDDFLNSLSAESNSSFPAMNPRSSSTATFSGSSMEASQAMVESPPKLSTPEAASPPILISYGNLNSLANPQQFNGNLVDIMNSEDEGVFPGNMTLPSDPMIAQGSFMVDQYHVTKAGQGTKRTSTATRSPSQSRDHIIAERKRREKLSERFIALSAIIPGLKKMDKTSVLGEAIKYVKLLQEQVKTLEEKTVKKTMESVVVVKKSRLLVDDESCTSDENMTGCSDELLPEIEARVSDTHVLLRIHCEKRKGVLVKTLAEIERLRLTVVNSNVMPFASSALVLTIVAKMENEFCMTVKDLVKDLRSAFLQFMRKEEDPSSVRA